MEFRILGPLEVCSDGGELALGGRKPRALVAVLALHANEVVAADRLIDEVWGEDVPEGAAAALRLNISRLRKALPRGRAHRRDRPATSSGSGPTSWTSTGSSGWWTRAGACSPTAGRPTRRRGCAKRWRVWRGPALADFAYEDFAQTAVARLEEIRLGALELRIDADLALGRHDELVGELKALVAEHPLRERFRGCLMTALYRSGRQAEALDAYQDARRTLVDELGIEPSPALQELERAILRQDRSLELPATSPGPVRGDAERSILVAVADEAHVDALLAVAEPLVRRPPRAMIVAKLVPDAAELRVGVRLARRAPIGTRSPRRRRPHGVVHVERAGGGSGSARHRARRRSRCSPTLPTSCWPTGFPTSSSPPSSPARRATWRCSSLGTRRRRAPCWCPSEGRTTIGRRSSSAPGWRARRTFRSASPVPLRVPEQGRRDASRLLSHASLAVQRVLGVAAEPVLTSPGEDGMLEASRDAGLLVVGLSTRWHDEGLGPARLALARHATPPTLFVHRGLRPGGLAPPAALTRFTWSIRP